MTDPSISEMTHELGEIYKERRRSRAEDLYLSPRGLTLQTFYSGQIRVLVNELAVMIDRQIINTSLELELVIAGVDRQAAHIYGIRDPGITDCYNSIGFHAIGSGAEHAIIMLAQEYSPDFSQNKMVQLLFEVKKSAQLAPGVGQDTDISVITDTDIKEIDVDKLKLSTKGV